MAVRMARGRGDREGGYHGGTSRWVSSSMRTVRASSSEFKQQIDQKKLRSLFVYFFLVVEERTQQQGIQKDT